MQIIRRRAYARAGLMGNPSDGYHGRTLSFIVRDFFAEVTLYEWPHVEIVWAEDDQSRFRSIHELADDVRLHGYYGGVRLVPRDDQRFCDYCTENHLPLHDRNFSIRYSTTIPRAVGLAGSSAIITATLRALMAFYDVVIPPELQASLVLSVETKELGIAAGLQDRVIQVFEGLVFMDFSEDQMRQTGSLEYGAYEPMDPKLLPPLYIAFSHDVGEPTDVVHTPLRARYQRGDVDVVAAMRAFANLASDAREALIEGDHARLHQLIDTNFDLRASICAISPRHRQMIETARSVGASAKFCGSGGAIVGMYRDASMFAELVDRLHAQRIQVLRPTVVAAEAPPIHSLA